MNSKPKKRNEYSNEAPERGTGKKRAPKVITEEYLRNAGLFYLQRFAATKSRFRDVMMVKIKKSCHWHRDQNYEHCLQMLDHVIERFEELNLIDDESYARMAVGSLRRQGKSRRAIIANLTKRGLASDLLEQTLKDHDIHEHENDADAEYQAARIYARKKRLGPYNMKRTVKKENDKKSIVKKDMNSMARAGFNYDIIRRVFNFELADGGF